LLAEQSSLLPALLLLHTPSLLTATSLGLMRTRAAHATAARSPVAPPCRRRGEAAAVHPGSCGQRATGYRRPHYGCLQVRQTVAQLPCCSSAAARPPAAGRRNRPDAPTHSSIFGVPTKEKKGGNRSCSLSL
jgi:hypothetical protein